MATYTVPGQNITYDIIDEGKAYRRTGTDLVILRKGGTIYQIPGSQYESSVGGLGNLPEYNFTGENEAALGRIYGSGFKFDDTRNIANFQNLTPVEGEVFTQTQSTTNPHDFELSSSRTGQVRGPGPTVEQNLATAISGNAAGVQTAAQAPAPTQAQQAQAQQIAQGVTPQGFQGATTGQQFQPQGQAQQLGIPEAQPQGATQQTYTVKSGDTLSSIAQKLGVRTSDITGYRSGNPNLIFPNEVLSVNKQVSSPIVSGTTDETYTPETTLDTLKKNYGLSITPEVYSSNPVKSIKDLVKEVMEATGLPDYKSRIDAIDAEMKSIQKEQEDKIAEVNDNPWLSEGLRSKKVTQIQNKYQNLIDGATNRLKLIQDAYDDARQEAQYAASLAVSIYDKERTFQQNQMEFIIEQAQNAVEAKAKAEEFAYKKQSDAQKYSLYILKLGTGSTELTSKQTSQAIQLSNSLKSHPAYSDMIDIATGIQGVRTGLSQENGFGDITAINAFQRMVDPGATVRSEDVVLLQSASAFIQKVLSDYPVEKLAKGSKLPDPVRAQMKKTAEDLYAVRAENYNTTVGNQYRSLSEASGIPFEFVGQEFPQAGVSDEDKTDALNRILSDGTVHTIEEDSGGFFDSFLSAFGLKKK